MKKVFIMLFTFMISFMALSPVYAMNTNYDLTSINTTFDSINTQYGTDFHVYSEEEYTEASLDTLWNKSYDEYLVELSKTDINDIYQECMDIINTTETLEVTVSNSYARSTSASKTVYFNNKCNTMTLKYKYTTKNSKKYFDTSVKPTATVAKKNNKDYFSMSSYTGSFKNSNQTYTVVAKGKIISISGTVSKTFTVNFNL